MTDHIIYMDNAATTATRPEVLEAMHNQVPLKCGPIQ